ncbi:MAG: hypothetical protein HY246_15590 [Proteobacteria bacterium]|nr:hypothetical protein [Pseudomonadota bacterium]
MAYGLPAEGTRRLMLLAGSLGVASYVIAVGAVLFLHGLPYWSGWWIAIAALLVPAWLVPRALASVLEWVIAGYKG